MLIGRFPPEHGILKIEALEIAFGPQGIMTFQVQRFFLLALCSCGGSGISADASDGGTDAPIERGLDDADAGCMLMRTSDNTCNQLMPSGSVVSASCVSGSAPMAMGGTIPDGRYVLTKGEYYNYPGPCPNEMERIDWAICGDEWSTVQDRGVMTQHLNFHVTSQGNQLSMTTECPTMAGGNTWTYDVLPNGLVFYIPSLGNSIFVARYMK